MSLPIASLIGAIYGVAALAVLFFLLPNAWAEYVSPNFYDKIANRPGVVDWVLWVPTLVYLPVLLGMGQPVVNQVWTPYSIAFVAGLGAIVVSLVLALLPGGSGLRATALIVFLVGVGAGDVVRCRPLPPG